MAVALVGILLLLSSVAGASDGVPLRPGPPTSAEALAATRAFLGTLDTAAKTSGGTGGTGGTGGNLFPGKRVVGLYGAPAMPATIIGRKSVLGAKRKLREQARPYDGRPKPVVRAFDLVVVLATADPGPDRKFRTRFGGRVIKPYLRAARALDGRLVLDIQPGRSSMLREVEAYRNWLRLPNVDVALDAEWNLGRRERPGDPGSVSARELNRISSFLNRLGRRNDLPPKLMVVHQFREGSVRNRRAVKQRNNVDVTLDFDGIGSTPAKRGGYKALTEPGLFNGIMLFYRLDDGLMSPRQVRRLDPPANLVLYQ